MPQEVKIISRAENFAIKKEYGGLVYQVINGTSWGNLTMEPGTYILSCNGGGAIGLMSASVCIENPMVGQALPSDTPPVLPRPDKEDKPTLIDSKPPLPKGPIEKIFVRPANLDDGNSNRLTMLIGDEKGIAVWGVDAGGNEQNVSVDDWKVYDDDTGWITKGLHNPAPKDARVKIKFKAGNKEGHTRIKATAINEEGNRISGVLSIEVTEVPPIIVTGRLKLCDEHNKPYYPSGVGIVLNARFYEDRADFNDRSSKREDDFITQTDATGRFKFRVPIYGEFAQFWTSIPYNPPAPAGYGWVNGTQPQHCAGQLDDSRWRGKLDGGKTIYIEAGEIFLDTEWPSPIQIIGEVSHHGNPVEGAEVRLVGQGKTLEKSRSNSIGEYELDVGNLPKGKYKLTAKYHYPRKGEPGHDPSKKMTMHQGWLYINQDIWVDLPLESESITIDINMISFGEKIGYMGP